MCYYHNRYTRNTTAVFLQSLPAVGTELFSMRSDFGRAGGAVKGLLAGLAVLSLCFFAFVASYDLSFTPHALRQVRIKMQGLLCLCAGMLVGSRLQHLFECNRSVPAICYTGHSVLTTRLSLQAQQAAAAAARRLHSPAPEVKPIRRESGLSPLPVRCWLASLLSLDAARYVDYLSPEFNLRGCQCMNDWDKQVDAPHISLER
jgi:hypothetical protein